MVGSGVRDWQSHDNEGRSRSALGYLNISLYRRQGFEVMGKTSSGAVPGAFTVTRSGQASYTVPIEVPPGPGGVAPGLSLTCTSSRMSGIAGVGWSLTGLSAITRCPKSSGTDGAPAPISDSSSDRFCLDGAPLFEQGDGTLRTEIDTFRRITRSGTQANPTSFTVDTKNGLVHTYGGPPAIDSHNGSTRVWMVRRVRDRSGNMMTIDYQRGCLTGNCFGSPLVPEQIRYGQHESTSDDGDRVVRFEYESRSDTVARWPRGAERTLTVRLRRIVTEAGGSEIRSYELGYDDDPT